MSASKNDHALGNGDSDLLKVRAEIDHLDQVILNAIQDRAALAAQVSQAKSGRHTFRPGREADLIRNLARASDLPSKLVEQIWRNIIAHNLTSQAGLKIAVLNTSNTRAAMTFRFGTNIQAMPFDAASDVIAAVAAQDAHLGILPEDQLKADWLDELHRRRNAGDDVFISAYTHMLDDHGLQQSVVLSSILPDPSQNDRTLIMQDGLLEQKEGHHTDASGIVGIVLICDIS